MTALVAVISLVVLLAISLFTTVVVLRLRRRALQRAELARIAAETAAAQAAIREIARAARREIVTILMAQTMRPRP